MFKKRRCLDTAFFIFYVSLILKTAKELPDFLAMEGRN